MLGWRNPRGRGSGKIEWKIKTLELVVGSLLDELENPEQQMKFVGFLQGLVVGGQ